MKTLADRFWAKVEKTETCWLWTASTTSFGYGQISVNKRPQGAHRVSYELANGPTPSGMQIDHMCHVPACVNPSHLQAVTQSQNLENRSGPTRANTSGVRGVGWHKATGKWRVFVKQGNQNHHGGLFANKADAEAAAIALRNRLMSNNLADRSAA